MKTFEQLRIETENFTKPCKRYLEERKKLKKIDRWHIGRDMELGDEMLNERLHV